MFDLIPSSRGWCLDAGDHRGLWFADREIAVAAAERSAQLRHRLSRRPTGVQVQVQDKWVLLARYG